MKIKSFYIALEKAKSEIENIDFINTTPRVRTINQAKINKAYNILEELTNELIRENIRLKQRRNEIDR